ncbi:hypothetical protein [Planktothricoides raciborskii]|nr:hypothetical protein [Planktothricoides raciborskii]
MFVIKGNSVSLVKQLDAEQLGINIKHQEQQKVGNTHLFIIFNYV